MTNIRLYNTYPRTIHERTSVSEAVQLLVQQNIGSFIVIGDEGTVTGIVSVSDILKVIVQKKTDKQVRDIMRRDFIAVAPDAQLTEVVDSFLKTDLLILPVIDGLELVGVITRTDIIRAVA